jgi:hypothetical protein
MTLSHLTPDEDAVLLGWMREIVQTDGEYTDAEREEVVKLRLLLGNERFDRAIVAANERFEDRAALKEGAKAITRPEARRAIYDFLRTLAESDEITAEEEKPLRWLASWWDLATP